MTWAIGSYCDRVRVLLVILVLAFTAPPAANAASALTAPTKVAKIGKQKVAYRSFGSGRPLVMVMGLGGTMGSWDPTFLDALAAGGHRIVLLDNEGVGRTTRLSGKLTIRRMGDTVAGLIARLKLKRPDVAGWSMGGMIAQSFAVRHPRSLRKLVLMATAPGDGKGVPPTPAALKALTAPSDLTAVLGLIFPAEQSAARDAYIANIIKRQPFEGVAPAAQTAKQTAASGAWMTGQDPDGRRVAKLRLPTLVAGGELDPLLPVGNQRHLHDIVKNSQLVTYPDASHAFLFQHQAEFLPKLLSFVT
jgi:pimeloyl-ACP methyl ester carboxylesterase